jgi:hypothetical protein
VNSADGTEQILQSSKWEAADNILYGMYAVTLNELKVVFKANAQAVRRCAVNETSVVLPAPDFEFQEVCRRKRHIYNDTSYRAKQSTKRVPTYAAVKLPAKAVSIP